MFKFLAVWLVLFVFAGCTTIGGVDTPSWFPSPDKPDGPKVAEVGQKVTFETEGTDPADVHEFQWDFGNGEVSDWEDDYEEIDQKYKTVGTFEVKVRERCPLQLFMSDWSKSHSITINAKKNKTVKGTVMSFFVKD